MSDMNFQCFSISGYSKYGSISFADKSSGVVVCFIKDIFNVKKVSDMEFEFDKGNGLFFE